MFHRIVAKFLYIAKNARSDLLVAVAFLCKRVKCPNIGDWKKLVMEFTNKTTSPLDNVSLCATRNRPIW